MHLSWLLFGYYHLYDLTFVRKQMFDLRVYCICCALYFGSTSLMLRGRRCCCCMRDNTFTSVPVPACVSMMSLGYVAVLESIGVRARLHIACMVAAGAPLSAANMAMITIVTHRQQPVTTTTTATAAHWQSRVPEFVGIMFSLICS